ncbi:cbb3-type cytochrome c oxidase subunit 3 [Agrobacterium vitis]|uniref:CcoQ/FixQ family Cbb3-type cytochrome c oxidase assembly chaperone n=1 Tax=Agrobacterium vitis TaxID=373 RepID=A0AAE5AVA4_AGRVI|nr:cbb3-type cytochrome c oxidase subunit 3 [Agrobacterium vitis]MCF1496673.1 cbb3-type cytochrome c oxidase subunit 3 [Allorhizobium sp. Av2]MCM2439749.1 cbb3-type cytochrome c oxidase subunit 3 [Agrobacterium vitis]MUZ57354.1 CcoQ/FixQ family Cbb3-type cytochrome c oxidase assembly chaperone [Agrobacterium vitis]MVA65663.1 CcoQ/FixQ family Cbb3-type cytochrome c oxidase assembly chaperone [Agrobacterium vitis]MVA86688.1 CcoQ/FixQ family Cbb3-type cytochrome c oxidase assembly chaperone [Agro
MEGTEIYTAMRHFADSWGMLAMLLFFAGAILFVFRPGAKERAGDAASIPLRED